MTKILTESCIRNYYSYTEMYKKISRAVLRRNTETNFGNIATTILVNHGGNFI